MMNTIPTNQDFADEVRSDRLTVLWKVALGLAIIIFWIALSLMIVQRVNVVPWLASGIALVVGALLTRSFLKRERYGIAVWCFALGCLLGAAIPLTNPDPLVQQIGPFIMPVLVFFFGLLMMPLNTLLLAVLGTLAVVFAPLLGGLPLTLTPYQVASGVLSLTSVLLAAQVTGEIFQVTEWALENYQRQARTNQQLFESRQELQRSLQRSQVLGEQLREANSELEAARAAAEEAKHFRGQFLANMSHELRTPLNAIIGFSETMLNFPIMYEDVRLPTQYEADLRQIYTSGKSLLHLINDILDLAKVDAGKLEVIMQPVEIEPVIRAVMSTAVGLIGAKPIELKRDIPAVIPTVYADESRVRQVLLNLYSNAAKFTDSGSILLTVRDTAEGVHFSLRDSGGGISTEDLGIIFEEFKQASSVSRGRDPRAGAGLGLAISRQLIQLMGGRIWAESAGIGHGSTFHFVIQKYQQPVAAAASASH
ncbi:MAG: HAMP domain-containing histidine kinase [Chloroflexi bacterium]|nr:HAMP domain-containing histidine kinase [Chloroflexota bacterium]